MAKRNENTPQTNKNTSNPIPEVRIASVIVLAIFLAVLVALAFRLVRWIIGF